ncbi:30S ribosomal protein S1 [Leptolinea tardivitalis]|uniref:30S ribosomal protein S1 n=1 Tax=Leptolinea tardivitalis TaxID=229920 RepID=UPI000781D0A4|nr:S1 RNA-binding domain-containing protein [Leptolinea tardivitalis]GAP20058.1 ribosomal protein S1 [Leptolinea tardivitalis]
MVGKPQTIPIEIMQDEMDEGWWAAVLADEESSTSDFTDTPVMAQQSTELMLVDWKRVKSIFENDEIIELQVYGYNRGGLLVQDHGIQGFVPVSHLIEMPCGVDEEERKATLSEYIGRSLSLKVIECEPSLDRIVLSERAAQAGEGRRKQLFSSLKIGDVVKGKVTNITDFGVFLDLGGVEGLIHVSELSWGRVQHPGDILSIGDCAEAMVLQINEETSRVALSYKRLQKNPWDLVSAKYVPGDEVPAFVTTITRFGVFARLNEGIEGLIHISSIEFDQTSQTLEELFSPGMPIKVQILHIDPDRRRLGLGYIQN